jgi:hypothetical protein
MRPRPTDGSSASVGRAADRTRLPNHRLARKSAVHEVASVLIRGVLRLWASMSVFFAVDRAHPARAERLWSDPHRGRGEEMQVTVQQLLEAHPRPVGDLDTVARCVETCAECATACTICADADLAESDVAEMIRCIRSCLDCADTCVATGRVAARQTARDTAILRALLTACSTACRVCAEECERHAEHHEHCRLCERSCRNCTDACEALLAALG